MGDTQFDDSVTTWQGRSMAFVTSQDFENFENFEKSEKSKTFENFIYFGLKIQNHACIHHLLVLFAFKISKVGISFPL